MQRKKEKDFIPKLNFQKENNLKRVLEVFGEPIISGGQEAFVNNVIENINCEGLYIDLFTPYYCNNELYKKNIENIGGKVFTAGLDFKPGTSRFNIKKSLDKILKEGKYDVVHIHSGSISVLAIASELAKKNKIKTIIVHSHSPAEHETLKHMLVKIWFYRIMKKYPTYYFACSLNAALCKFPKKIALNKTKFIKNGINLDKYKFDIEKRKKIRKYLKLNENDYLIGHVGRFSKEKNHKFLIEMVDNLVTLDSNIKLILIGDGELKKDIEERVKKRNLTKNVIFTGNIINVDEYMQAMDCFVLPSLYEGLPFVGVEAQAAGVPIIVSNGVSHELQLTNSVQFEDLEVDKWVEKIKKNKNIKRYDNILTLKKAGFDITQTASILRDIYLEE